MLVALMVWACVATFPAEPSSLEGVPEVISQGTQPPPGPVPPNASRITGMVIKVSVWPPGSFQNSLPRVPPDQTFYSIQVEIQTSDPEDTQSDNLARPGSVIEAFSLTTLGYDLVGKKIIATLKLTGDTRGVRWLISNVQIF
jgi:hypothetical protein